jgi:2'-phosphotransferase
LNPTISDLQELISSNPRQKFSLKLKSDTLDQSLASSWLIRGVPNQTSPTEVATPGTPITLEADNIPDVVIYGTSYATYPLILSSGSLKKMGGTAIQLSTSGPEEGAMRGSDSEVLIYLDVRKALENDSNLQWWLSESGNSVSVTEVKGAKGVPDSFWKRIVGRKGDVGLLWEAGEVVKEVPVGFRGRKEKGGKGLKGRAGGAKSKGAKGKGRSLNTRSDEDSFDDDDSH